MRGKFPNDEEVTDVDPASADGEAGDEVLMTRYQAGDLQAFDALYARHKGPVFRFFLRQLATVDAEEAHQEVWLKLIRARDRYTPTGAFGAYLFTIAHNVLNDRHRRLAKHAVVGNSTGSDPHDPAPTVADQLDHRQRADLLYSYIKALPIAQREALMLREESGLGIAEIAEVTGSTTEGIKSRLRYAMQKLRVQMQNHA
jgi:RNA polymerase sigma-70 factor (ECF subfamily)